jgi:hypothetical protein
MYSFLYSDYPGFQITWIDWILLTVMFTALNPLSCEAYKNAAAVGQRAQVKIDVDGSGPLKPFPVTCEYYGMVHPSPHSLY